jgi:hypothetical protein
MLPEIVYREHVGLRRGVEPAQVEQRMQQDAGAAVPLRGILDISRRHFRGQLAAGGVPQAFEVSNNLIFRLAKARQQALEFE